MDVKFGPYLLKRSGRQLLGPKGPAVLSARAFDILSLLLEKPDQVIGKDALFQAVWPGIVIGENTLQVHVSALRKALGTGMVMTVHGQGYKYTGPRPFAVAADGATGDPVASDPPDTPLPMLNMTGAKALPVTGGCLCGEIRYRITGAAIETVICHCRMCQRFSGSAFSVGSVYASDAVTFTKGAPKFYRSSPFAERGFCADCGSSLVFRPTSPAVSPQWENWTLIETGTLDNPAPNAPTWHLGVESQMPWLDLPPGGRRVRCQESPDVVEAWAAFGLPVP